MINHYIRILVPQFPQALTLSPIPASPAVFSAAPGVSCAHFEPLSGNGRLQPDYRAGSHRFPHHPLNVLIGCECSGRVRRAFRARGHNAWSCDLQPAEDGSPFHIQGDVLEQLQPGRWDILIGHPDCTYLCNSGVRWLHTRAGRWSLMEQACAFFLKLWNAPIDRVAVENPVMHGHAKSLIGIQQTQTVQPWWFGDPERKATCLWLRGLDPLTPTNPVLPLGNSVHREAPGPERKRNRSRTFQGLADAMASHWSNSHDPR